jgi:hypothetical protein
LTLSWIPAFAGMTALYAALVFALNAAAAAVAEAIGAVGRQVLPAALEARQAVGQPRAEIEVRLHVDDHAAEARVLVQYELQVVGRMAGHG